MIKFFISIITLTLVLLGIQFLVFHSLDLNFNPVFGIFYLYLFAITTVAQMVLRNQQQLRPQMFVSYFMGIMGIKLFLSLILMLFLLWFNREIKVQLAIVFMILYTAYTTLSVMSLLSRLKGK